MLYTEFRPSTIPGTCQKVCGGVGGVGGEGFGGVLVRWVCKTILVFSFGQAEQ